MSDANLYAQGGPNVPFLDESQTDLSMLAATVTIPIKIAPAPAALAPNINLVYSSAAAQSVVSEEYSEYTRAQASVVGYGWSIGNGGCIDTADNTDFAYLTLNGVSKTLIKDTSGQFRAQEDDFTKVRFYDGQNEGGTAYRYFKIWGKEGTEYRFGHETARSGSPNHDSAGSRQDVWWGWKEQYEWGEQWYCFAYPKRYYLDRVTDVHGNVIEISYSSDRGDSPDGNHYDVAVYPTRILYTTNNNVSGQPYRRLIQFNYSAFTPPWETSRQDVLYIRDVSGVTYYDTRALDQIVIKVEGENTGANPDNWLIERRYDLGYEYRDGENCNYDVPGSPRQQKFLILKSVTEKDGNGTALPSTTFDYADKECWVLGENDPRRIKLPLLTSIANGYGASVTWAYSSYEKADDSSRGNAKRVQYWAVASRTVTDGVSGLSNQTSYAPFNPGSPNTRIAAWTTKFDAETRDIYDTLDYWHPALRGFTAVKVTEPTGHIHEHRFYRGLRGDIDANAKVRRSDGTDLDDLEELKGREYEVRWFENATDYANDSAATNYAIARDWTLYASSIVGTNTNNHPEEDKRDRNYYRVFISEQRTTRRIGTTQSSTMKKTFSYETTYGNLTDVYEYADASQHWTRRRQCWYYPRHSESLTASGEPICSRIVGKIAREDIYQWQTGNPGTEVLERRSHYIYDSNTAWDQEPTSRGLLALTRQQVASNKFVDTAYTYDVYGHLTTTTRYGIYGNDNNWAKNLSDNDPRVTTIGYDSQYLFATSETNALNQTTIKQCYTTGGKFGLVRSLTDPNGCTTEMDYDSFGRQSSLRGPVVGVGSTAYRKHVLTTYSLPSPQNGQETTLVSQQTRVDNGGTEQWSEEHRHYDGLGRLVQEHIYGNAGPDGVYPRFLVNSHYDGRGQLWTRSVPHIFPSTYSDFIGIDWTANDSSKTVHTYDALGRPRLTTLPDNKTTEMRYEGFDVVVIDQNRHAKRLKRDGLGRTIQVIEYGGDIDHGLSEYAATTYGYNAADQLTSVVDALENQTSIQYDMLGRKTQLTDPDMGTWQYGYNPTGTLSWQKDGKAPSQQIDLYYDKLDRLVRKWYPVCWTDPAPTKPTVYDLMELRAAVVVNQRAAQLATLDPDTTVLVGGLTPSWGNLEIIAGKDVQVRATHFQDLRTAIVQLRALVQLSTPGFTQGNLVAGSRRIHVNDLADLRRWLEEYETSAASKRARVYVEYDRVHEGEVGYGIGRRTALWDSSGYATFQWDPMGRQTWELRWIDGHKYVTRWTYDAFDRVRTVIYPDFETLTFTYGLNTVLNQITSTPAGGSTLTLASDVHYNALKLPTLYTLGSGPTAQVRQSYYGLDATGSPYGAMKTIQLQQGTSSMLVNRDIGYDAVGNVTSINDLVNSEPISYEYDEQDRLTSAGSPVSETYEYNQIGNITKKNGLTFAYDATHKHAVSGYNGASYTYDANGCLINTTARGGQVISYDPESRPVRVASGGATLCRFAYDGDGIRRKRLDVNGTIHYQGAYERNVGNGRTTTEVVTKYYTATFGKLSRLIAFRRAGVLYWVGTDHLGGTIRVADANFNPVDGMRYLPYGGSRDAGTSLITDHKFTAQIEDQSIGLYWYNSRAYDPAIGRFLVPDSIVPDPTNPQALNRFSYCVNNPLRYTDPTGHDYDDDYWGGIPVPGGYQVISEEAPGSESFDADYYGGIPVPGNAGASGASYSSSQSLPLGQMTPQLAQFMMEQQGAAQGPYWDTYPTGPEYSCRNYSEAGADMLGSFGPLVDQITSDWNGFDYARTATSLIGIVAGSMSDVPGANFVATQARPVAAVATGAAGYERELAGGHSEGRAAAVGFIPAGASLVSSTWAGAAVGGRTGGPKGMAIGALSVLVTGIAVQTGTEKALRESLDWLGIK